MEIERAVSKMRFVFARTDGDYIDDDGAVRTGDASVGVSVTLDWNKGGDHDVDL